MSGFPFEAPDRTRVEFLNQQLYVDQVDGEQYEADLLAKVRLLGAEPEAFFLVHVFRYFSAILERHGVAVYPMVIYSHDTPRRQQPSVFRLDASDGLQRCGSPIGRFN